MSLLPTVSTTARPQAHGLHVRLGDNLYRLVELADARPVIQTAPIQPPRIDTSASPEDIRPEVGVFFSMPDFRGGEGQGFLHRENSSPQRYWDSTGIEVAPPPPGRASSVRLLRGAALLDASTHSNLHLATDGTALYMASDETVRRSTNFMDPSPTFADEDPHASQSPVTVRHLASLGTDVYAALGTSGIHRRSGTWSHWSDLEAVRVWAAKGRIVASTGPALYEAKVDATSVLLHTLGPGISWTSVVETGGFVLAAATDGVIYAFALDENTATLSLASRTPVSQEDGVYALGYHPSGLVFYATRAKAQDGVNFISRLFRAGLNELGSLTFSTLIRQFGTPEASDVGTISAITAHQESMYFGIQESGATSLWRYDLETTGRNRDVSVGVAGDITSILVVAGTLLFTRATGGVYRQSTTFASSGYLITSLADHFTASIKNWAGATIDIEALDGGIVELWYSTDPEAIHDPAHPSWILARRVKSGQGSVETSIDVESRYLTAKIVLIAGFGGISSPSVRSFSFRAFPGPTDVILQLPINVSDQIEIPGLRRLRAPNYGHLVYDSLKNIEGTNQEVVLFSPPETLYGLVESVTTPVMALTPRGTRTLVSLVQVRGRRTGSVSISADGGMGIEPLGIQILGGLA